MIDMKTANELELDAWKRAVRHKRQLIAEMLVPDARMSLSDESVVKWLHNTADQLQYMFDRIELLQKQAARK